MFRICVLLKSKVATKYHQAMKINIYHKKYTRSYNKSLVRQSSSAKSLTRLLRKFEPNPSIIYFIGPVLWSIHYYFEEKQKEVTKLQMYSDEWWKEFTIQQENRMTGCLVQIGMYRMLSPNSWIRPLLLIEISIFLLFTLKNIFNVKFFFHKSGHDKTLSRIGCRMRR